MRDNALKKSLKAGDFALGTLVWDIKSVGRSIRWLRPVWTIS